jgi:hypothetical protein
MSSPDASIQGAGRSLGRRVLFAACTLAIGGLLLEVALLGLSMMSTSVHRTITFAGNSYDPKRMPDDTLGERPNPDWPDHDSAGFRNEERLLKAKIVALGDSQTYGTGVSVTEAWPQALGELTDSAVYNMGFPGYGPPQQLVLMEEALALEPEVVIATLYAGNDLYDAFKYCYVDGLGEALGSPTAESLTLIEASEAHAPLVNRVMAAYANRRQGVIGLVSRHSLIYGLMRATKRLRKESKRDANAAPLTWEALAAKAARRPGKNEAFESGDFRTVFTPAYRGLALDQDDPCVLEGQRLCIEALTRMNTLASERGAKLIVLLIPTKEHAFGPLVESTESTVLDSLLSNERALWSNAKEALSAAGIEYIDGATALQSNLSAGTQPYPNDTDGHPNPAGQRALATAIAAQLP